MEFSEPDDQGVIKITWKILGGTVHATENFLPSHDAEHLYRAMKGLGTEEEVIINILGSRTRFERREIGKSYKQKFKKDLIKDLKNELSGDFKNTVKHLMWSSSQVDARALHKAMKGLGTDEQVLVDIICTKTNRKIEELKESYKNEYDGKALEEEVSKETSGAFKHFLLAVLKGDRFEGDIINIERAEKDALELYNMTVKNWSPSDPKFMEIFAKRSFGHIFYVFFYCWPKLSSEDLLKTIDKECEGDIKKTLKSIIQYSIFIPSVYYARRLNETMKGLGTKDNQLIYIITSRCEIDLSDIKDAYAELFDTSLSARIKDDTSGDYKKMLLKLIGE